MSGIKICNQKKKARWLFELMSAMDNDPIRIELTLDVDLNSTISDPSIGTCLHQNLPA